MFRIKNVNNNIKYYTIVIDHDQIKENKDDTPHMIIKRKSRVSKKSRQYENFVFDKKTGKWYSEMMYY